MGANKNCVADITLSAKGGNGWNSHPTHNGIFVI